MSRKQERPAGVDALLPRGYLARGFSPDSRVRTTGDTFSDTYVKIPGARPGCSTALEMPDNRDKHGGFGEAQTYFHFMADKSVRKQPCFRLTRSTYPQESDIL